EVAGARLLGLGTRPGLAGVRQFAQGEAELLLLAFAPDAELDRSAGRHRADLFRKLARVLHGLPVDRGDHVARLDPGLGGWAIGLRLGHEGAFRIFQPEAVGDIGRDLLDLHADPAARHLPALLELGDHGLDRVGGNREPDPDRAAGRREDRGVHADDVAVHVEARSTGIALVDRRVDLDEVVVGTGSDVAAARGDDAGRHGAAEPER